MRHHSARSIWLLLPGLALVFTGCSAYLPFDDLSGGQSTTDPKCTWQLSAEHRFTTDGRPFALDVADFDSDGVPDVVLAENDAFADVDYAIIETLLYRGDRTFENWYTASKNSSPGGSMITRGMAAGDVDKDGIADAVQTFASYDYVDGSFDLNRGIGDGRLEWDGIWTVPKPDAAALGDFDGDGWLDAAMNALTDDGGYANEKLYLLWGDGQGSFEMPIEYAPSSVFTKTIREIHAADLDNDGLSDLVLTSWGDATVQVLRGTGDRGLHQLAAVTVGSAPWGLAPADFDGDQKLDLAVVNNGDYNVSLLFGSGDGGLERETPIPVGKNIKPVLAEDLDKDGDVDLAIAGQGEIFTLLNNGDGTFGEPVSHAMDGTANRSAAADFDQDGYIDLALSNLSRDSFSVFWGGCVAP